MRTLQNGRRLCHPLHQYPETSPAAAGRNTAGAATVPLLSVARALALAARLEQEPATLFRLVDEHLEEACGRHVIMLVGDLVRRAHVTNVRLVVVRQLEQHVDRGYISLIVVLDPLQLGDVPETSANIDDLVADVGYRPATPVEVGVRKFVEWYLSYYGQKAS